MNNNSIKLILGDAISEMKKINAKSVDLIIADPPYNLGKDYGNNNDNKLFDDYLSFTLDWTREAKRILKDSGTIYVFMGFRYISYLYTILEKELKLKFNNWLVWHYTQGIGKKRGFSPRHDDILMFVKSEKFTFNLDDVRIPQKFYRSVNNMRGANPGDIWKFSHVHYCNDNRQDHPTQKPEGLIERMILASSNENDTVLDPFLGSGTTTRVCQQLHRNCIGIEINPQYIELAQERLFLEFKGFDSIDSRMMRIPNDLNDPNIRDEYLKNHVRWFLRNHENEIEDFWKKVDVKYGNKINKVNNSRSNQLSFMDNLE